MSKRMIDSEVSNRIKYGYDENNESHIKIEADNVDVPFLFAGGSGIYSDGQVSAPNIVTDEMSTRVADSINFANAIKATGGFTPIHTYKLDGMTTLYVYFEHNYHGGFIGYGWITNMGDGRACIFHYSLQNGKVIRFKGISDDTIYEYSSDSNLTKTFSIAKADNVQAKLYRHRITLRNASSADGTCMLDWISSNNLNCHSLEDLRTLLGNPQMQSYVASNPSGDLFGVVITTSTAQFKKAGTTSLVNITSVDDTVTPL